MLYISPEPILITGGNLALFGSSPLVQIFGAADCHSQTLAMSTEFHFYSVESEKGVNAPHMGEYVTSSAETNLRTDHQRPIAITG